jgi:hypothetical protein
VGWLAVRADDPDDAFLAFYCLVFADSEFGPSRRIDSGQTDAL